MVSLSFCFCYAPPLFHKFLQHLSPVFPSCNLSETNKKIAAFSRYTEKSPFRPSCPANAGSWDTSKCPFVMVSGCMEPVVGITINRSMLIVRTLLRLREDNSGQIFKISKYDFDNSLIILHFAKRMQFRVSEKTRSGTAYKSCRRWQQRRYLYF